MNSEIIKLATGYAVVPGGSIVVDISDDKRPDYVGIISDCEGELTRVVVLSDISLMGLSDEQEENVINKAIKDLPEHKSIKEEEIPFPGYNAGTEELLAWYETFRLGFYPLGMFLDDKDYVLVRTDES